MKHNINELGGRYWECESTLEEENILKSYFTNEKVAEEHLPFQDWFVFTEKVKEISSESHTDIDVLLDKYWEGETTIKEEGILKAYFNSGRVKEEHLVYSPLFEYFEHQNSISYEDQVDASNNDDKLPVKTNTRVVIFKKWIFAIAAILVLGIASISVMQLYTDQDKTQKSALVNEIEDPEEALRVTKEALALVSSKFRASQQTVKKNLGALEKAAIFK